MPTLEVREIVKRYGNGTLANDGLSLSIEPGEIYGLLGPNGAGKTTLVGQVLGLLRPTGGSIHVLGTDIVADPGFARRSIGYLPQAQVGMEDIHVDELIHSVARLRGLSKDEADARTEQLIAELRLEEFRSTRMRATSGGVRRLAGFATAIVANANVLVLDEPTNDVDPVRRQLLWKLITAARERGASVLLVTHNLAEADRVIDRLAIIDHGRILREGRPSDLRREVSDKLRLELTTIAPLDPHPALDEEGTQPGRYLFDRARLAEVSTWLGGQQDAGTVVDFRIEPPSLDDIYLATVGESVANEEQPA